MKTMGRIDGRPIFHCKGKESPLSNSIHDCVFVIVFLTKIGRLRHFQCAGHCEERRGRGLGHLLEGSAEVLCMSKCSSASGEGGGKNNHPAILGNCSEH